MNTAPKAPRCATCQKDDMVLLPGISSIANVWYFRCPACGDLAVIDKTSVCTSGPRLA